MIVNRIRNIVFWRLEPELLTYTNGVLLVMIISGLILWHADAATSTAVRDILVFHRSIVTHREIAGAMIFTGLLPLFRRLYPHELLIVFIPYLYFVFVLTMMTLVFPGPSRPLARVWTWGLPIILTTFYQFERLRRGDV